MKKLKGHTPDISKFWMFSFYDNIKYLDSEVKLPDSRVLTGKFVRFEPDKGETLVYRIIPNHHHKGEKPLTTLEGLLLSLISSLIFVQAS